MGKPGMVTEKAGAARWGVVGQAQLAHHMTWLDPLDDGKMVWQSVVNWTAARVQANQYHMNGSQHGQGADHGHDHDQHHDCECGHNCGS